MENPEVLVAHIMMGVSVVMTGLIMYGVDLTDNKGLIGYRTPRSIKTVETWAYANRLAKTCFTWASVIIITVMVATALILDGMTSIIVSTIVLVAAYLGIIILIEVKLRQHFNEYGRPKRGRDRF